MKTRILAAFLLLTLLMAPTSGRATGEIRLSDDGKTVIMPAETFRAREADLLRLEALVQTLTRQLAEERGAMDRLTSEVLSLEAALRSERNAAESLQLSLRGEVAKARRLSGLIGFVLGGVVVGVAK